MKVIEIQNYGDSSTLKKVETVKPTIGNEQVLIKIKASSINPVDIKIRMGYLAGMLPKTFPIVLGWEASGIIEEVGSQVKDLTIGDEVYTMPNFMQGGTYAEYVAVNSNEVALKPTTISFAKASTVPMVAGAAYTSLIKVAQVSSGQKILIHGAAGAVGSYAVQMAKEKGLYVIGTATGTGIEFLKNLGADEVIDYTTTDFLKAINDLDVVLDLVGGETLEKSYNLLKKGGILISTVMPPSADKAIELGIRVAMTNTAPDVAMLNEIAKLIDAGKLKVQEPILSTLDNAQTDHQLLENRTAKGKIVFQIN